MFASEYWDIVPDIVTMSKSLAGGLPLSALTARTDIIEVPQVGQIGGTFCGNPVASVAALKVIEVMERDDFAGKAKKIGEIMKPRLESMKEKYEIIGDVRGRGAMMAFELVKDRKTKLPAKDETKAIQKLAYENGLILLSAGIYSNVIRTLVPLVITEEQLNAGLDIIEKAVSEVNKSLT
jgi:4-aminobutyrate aminotransferase/(S)-3-amino-2-methylpropionate transaminase